VIAIGNHSPVVSHQRGGQAAEQLARSRRHSIPEAVLEETGVLDFLRT
jgi:hypothetical protein